MADYSNIVRVELDSYNLSIKSLLINSDEKSDLSDKPQPGDIVSFKLVIRINADLTWTVFRGSWLESAKQVMEHGLVLGEETAKTLFAVFARNYSHPYKFRK